MNAANHDQLFPAPIGERLRIAREARGMTLDEIASRTRIPTRHLQHIEKGEWDALPAATYSVGFARAYANAIGLNGTEIGAELREQLVGAPRNKPAAAAYYEPADPARVPPRSLAIVAGLIALLLILGYALWRSGAVDDSDVEPAEAAGVETILPEPEPVRPAAAPQAGPAGPVVITATQEVWFRVYEGNGGPRIAERTLRAGERYEVPATAKAPQLLTGRPDAIRVTVGTTEIPPLGEPERTISDVSLLPADLLARTQRQPPR
ncbi:MAG TPA: helix-turn-helix domain-containing protein [Allosphingosinicella sp.]|nr:helix-turn-helix domain-containing protein [Allosphingosinicella sp.]